MRGGGLGGPLSWIVTNWRLKLLSLLLAVGLLGGVAFSENPPTFDSVPERVDYHNLAPDLVVTNPKWTVDVPVAGFRSDVQRYRQASAGVTVDLTNARPGTQIYIAQPRLDLPGLTFRQSNIPIALTIEQIVTRQLDIEVRTKNRAAGIAIISDKTYATCGNANDHCQVTVAGPTTMVNGLKAYVDYDVPINSAATGSSPNQPVRFEYKGTPIALDKGPRTIPPISWTPEVVTVVVTTQGGTQTKTVPVNYRMQGTQACGYQISSVDLLPNQVTVNGPADSVSRITAVNMDPINITGLSSSQRLLKSVSSGFSSVNVEPQQVSVVVNVNPAFSCAAPSPAPGQPPAAPAAPAPSPTPTPIPTPRAT